MNQNSLSYWERTELLDFDLVVVGGGIVGHFTALEFAQAHPRKSIALLERGILPSGASTKNAGFACFGSTSELEDDLITLGEDRLIELVLKRFRGLERMREKLGDQAIDYQPVGGYELLLEGQISRTDFFNDLLELALGARPFQDASQEEFGFSSNVQGLTKNTLEGTVNTGKLMRTLSRAVSTLGVQVFTGTEVSAIQEHTSYAEVQVSGFDHGFRAQQIAICTNAFTKALLPQIDLQPGRGMVLVSKPLKGFQLTGSFHYHSGYNYFRSVGDRLLLGGGRHLDLNGENTTNFGINERIQSQLLSDMENLIAPGRGLELDYTWSGIMAFGPHKKPIIEKVSDRIFIGARSGGMGVAIGALIGEELATIIKNC